MGRKKKVRVPEGSNQGKKVVYEVKSDSTHSFIQDNAFRDEYLVIGGSKVFVNKRGSVSGIESLERVTQPSPPADDNNSSVDCSITTNDSDIDDYGPIEVYESMLGGESPFLQKFSEIDVGNQRTVEDILGYDDSDDSSELEKIPSTSAGHENLSATTMLLYRNRSIYGRHKREKKKKTKEKRLQRLLSRGFSLEYLDELIRNFVLQGSDMHALPQMTKNEVEQVRKLASLYKCKCSLQGTSGKGKKHKNIPILIATNDMEIPSGSLEEERARMFALEAAALKKLTSANPHIRPAAKNKGSQANRESGKISFVSDGHIHPDESFETQNEARRPTEEISPLVREDEAYLPPSLETKPMAMMTKADAKALAKKRKKDERRKGSSPLVQAPYASFEKHTTGIGSKLLSKWGFDKGVHTGLGKQNDGIAEPIKVSARPKGLGLGA